jgi:hypothetical protein
MAGGDRSDPGYARRSTTVHASAPEIAASVPTQTDDSPIRSWPGFDPAIHGR